MNEVALQQWQRRQQYQRINPIYWRMRYNDYYKRHTSQQTKDMIAEKYGDKWLK